MSSIKNKIKDFFEKQELINDYIDEAKHKACERWSYIQEVNEKQSKIKDFFEKRELINDYIDEAKKACERWSYIQEMNKNNKKVL